MDRRNFFKLAGTASGAALSGACSEQADVLLPLLIPETEIPLGVAEWRPSVCRECGAGCGTRVRVMAAEREVERDGERYRQRVAAIKKIEGNPDDPISGGRLCGRGQAAVQRLYLPARAGMLPSVKNAAGHSLVETSWDAALDRVAEKLRDVDPAKVLYVARPGVGLRSVNAARFLKALGAPGAVTLGVADFAVEREAARLVFGWDGLPVYEIQEADYVLSIGADFLGGWVSPVLYARRFGHFRQGRETVRGMLAHAESRFSQTAWAADRWLPVRPGRELELAQAIGKLLLDRGAPASEATTRLFGAADAEALVAACGVEMKRVIETVDGLLAARRPLVVAGASIVGRSSTAAVACGLALNELLGAVGREGGVLEPEAPPEEMADSRPRTELESRIDGAEVILLDGADGAYLTPWLRERWGKTFLVSLASAPDHSLEHCDVLLASHDPLESEDAVWAEGSPAEVLNGAAPFVRPLYDTKPHAEILAELAGRLEKPFEASGAGDWLSRAERRRGGRWMERTGALEPAAVRLDGGFTDAQQQPEIGDLPLTFQAYFSPLMGDGSSAALPWIQEAPDPTSSAMWGLPVEIDPGTAQSLGLKTGDPVVVESRAGELRAPVYVNPAAIPGVVSMAVGGGENPLALLDGTTEAATGAAVMTTAVRIRKTDAGAPLIQHSGIDRHDHLVRIG